MLEYMSRVVAIQPPHASGTYVESKMVDGIEVAKFELESDAGYAWAWTLDDSETTELQSLEVRVSQREPTPDEIRAPKSS